MLLSVTLFALGVGLVSLLFLVEKQLQENFEKNLAGIDLVIGAKGSPLQLILSSMYHIDAPTGNISIKEARPFLNPKHPLIDRSIPLSMGDSYKSYRILGTVQDIVNLYEGEIEKGKIWEKNFEVTIGSEVARALGLDIGSEFQSSHGFMDDENLAHDDAEAFRVVGILKPSGTVLDQLILCTPQSFWLVHDHSDSESDHDHEDHDHEHHDHEHHDHENASIPLPLLDEDPTKEITSVLLTFKNRSYQALNMQRNINENTDLLAATPAIEINRLFSLMNTGEQALRILAFVIIFVSALSIFISLFSSLKARKYELALMRVMGAHPSKLFYLIILEGLLLAFLGFIIGMILAHGGMEIFAGALKSSYRYSFTGLQFLTKEWWLLAGSLILGFIAAVIPAFQASKTDIADTMTKG